MAGCLGIAVLWGLAGVLLVALGRYDSMPFWFQFGSGASIFAVFGFLSFRGRDG